MKGQNNSTPTMEDIEALASALKNLQQQEKDGDEKDINITKQPAQVSAVAGLGIYHVA